MGLVFVLGEARCIQGKCLHMHRSFVCEGLGSREHKLDNMEPSGNARAQGGRVGQTRSSNALLHSIVCKSA